MMIIKLAQDMDLNSPTPWGKPDHVKKLADGIFAVSTSSHGGFFVDQPQYEQMSETARACSYTGDQWFEEDCSWVAVALSFPNIFNAHDLSIARKIAAVHYPKLYTSHVNRE